MNENQSLTSTPIQREYINLGDAPEDISAAPVTDYVMKVKKITTTDEAKVQVVLETEGASFESLEQLKRLLVLQQTCAVLVSMQPAQMDLFQP